MNHIKKLAVGCIVLVIALLGLRIGAADRSSLPDKTVMITNLGKNHGGSGTIVQSTEQSSYILTNSHICEVVKSGGFVIAESKEYAVAAYKQSSEHDLCVIRVNQNLQVNTAIARRAPATYEPAVISGRPNLYPTVVTYGHFSGNIIQYINAGTRECSESEKQDPTVGLFCMSLGQLPLIRAYETVLVTAMIMPGSSGSGVYNSSGELSGVVFAGNGSLGYALTVPYGYMHRFLTVEAPNMTEKYPDLTQNFTMSQPQIRSSELTKVCSATENEEQDYLCAILKDSIDFNL